MCCPDTAINRTSPGMAYACLCLNIFFPGVGTMVNSCMGPFTGIGFLYGLIQLFFFWTLVGWVWAILYGVEIVRKSKRTY